MTLQESLQMQEKFVQKIESILSAMTSPSSKFSGMFCESYNSIIHSISSTYPAAVSTLSQTQQSVVQLCSNINYTGIEAVINAIEQMSNNLVDSISLLDNLPYQILWDSLSTTLEQVEPYLPPEEKEQCETIIRPQLKEKSRTHLTLSEVLAFLNLLTAIFFGLVTSMPDDQAERIIAQNETIIEQQAEIIQLKKEDADLLNALDSLSNSINLLTEEVELLHKELENSSDSSNGSSQTNPEDTQQQNDDTQN